MDLDYLDKKYSQSAAKPKLSVDGYFGEATAGVYKNPPGQFRAQEIFGQRSNSTMGFEDENSAGPVSGRINYNTVEYAHRNSGHGNYDLFQSTRFLDHQNKALAAEKV